MQQQSIRLISCGKVFGKGLECTSSVRSEGAILLRSVCLIRAVKKPKMFQELILFLLMCSFQIVNSTRSHLDSRGLSPMLLYLMFIEGAWALQAELLFNCPSLVAPWETGGGPPAFLKCCSPRGVGIPTMVLGREFQDSKERWRSRELVNGCGWDACRAGCLVLLGVECCWSCTHADKWRVFHHTTDEPCWWWASFGKLRGS